MEFYTNGIRIWAIERGLDKANPINQLSKLLEEIGELASGVNKNDRTKIVDSIGDTYVVLTILAMQLNLDIETCIAYAYNEIKNRKGKLVNGIFVKEEDLKGE
jgi:NTP pyrophosphatase (non-canonical NTP hydrolase)